MAVLLQMVSNDHVWLIVLKLDYCIKDDANTNSKYAEL
jgi:hypothetical protein